MSETINKKLVSSIDYSNTPKVLQVKDLRVDFKSDSGMVHAVRGVSFDLYKGETLCIVGESGSGKSVTSKTVMGILPGNAVISSGQILYNGEDLIRVSEEEFHRIRGHKIGMIFQDPLSSLNPIMKVGKQIIEATMINKNVLKSRFNELIAPELVVLRNEKANLQFEGNKTKNAVEILSDFKKEFLSLSKKEVTLAGKNEKNKIKENNEELKKCRGKIKTYFVNYSAGIEFEIDSLKSQIESISKAKNNENIKVNTNIKDIRIKNINNHILDLQNLEKIQYDENNIVQFIEKRITDLKALYKNAKLCYSHLKPLLTRALKQSKKFATIDTKNYAESLKKVRDKKLVVLNKKMAVVRAKLNELVPTLNQDELKNYAILMEKEEERENSFSYRLKHIFKKESKEEVTTGLARASIKKDIITKTGNVEFDKIFKEYVGLAKDIENVNDDYINKTKITKAEAKRIALEVMTEVGIPLPKQRFKQYPFEFSGGMRQRIVIAIALTANPDILICDEPTTALDVTIQAQILELINKLKRERGLSCIFITHDLGVVANMADRVAVMYAGKIVEYGTSLEIFFEPKHPYTWALLSSIPDIDSKERLESIAGTPPDMRFPPDGDAFALRSKYALAVDFKFEPPYFKISDTHYAATWLLYPGAPKVEMPRIVKTRIENALKGVK